mmetsp:Transcript_12379/g.40433  ORF Transcript_12379/g.40433 Transcript_12379/m.40433 type:complete len:219 (-) Transcript_12379:602-1258(-)
MTHRVRAGLNFAWYHFSETSVTCGRAWSAPSVRPAATRSSIFALDDRSACRLEMPSSSVRFRKVSIVSHCCTLVSSSPRTSMSTITPALSSSSSTSSSSSRGRGIPRNSQRRSGLTAACGRARRCGLGKGCDADMLFNMLRPVSAALRTTSRRRYGIRQRNPGGDVWIVKSRAARAPRGQFSSDLSGCRMMSTSSRRATPLRSMVRTSAATLAWVRSD